MNISYSSFVSNLFISKDSLILGFCKSGNIHKPSINQRNIRESLEINNLETKAEYEKSIKVFNRE